MCTIRIIIWKMTCFILYSCIRSQILSELFFFLRKTKMVFTKQTRPCVHRTRPTVDCDYNNRRQSLQENVCEGGEIVFELRNNSLMLVTNMIYYIDTKSDGYGGKCWPRRRFLPLRRVVAISPLTLLLNLFYIPNCVRVLL